MNVPEAFHSGLKKTVSRFRPLNNHNIQLFKKNSSELIRVMKSVVISSL